MEDEYFDISLKVPKELAIKLNNIARIAEVSTEELIRVLFALHLYNIGEI